MSSEIVIQTRDLGKAYRIYKRPQDRLKQFLVGRFKKFFQEYWALQGVSLDIHKGEAIGVIGRNGSGKSTFLQMVCGTLAPSTGTIDVRGKVAALLELGAGFNPEFTGRENVYLSASVLGLTQEEITARFGSILDFAGIGDFIDQPVKVYSSGMYARLAFAVVAHVDADILIIDEILAVGDAAFTQKCMKFIHQFKKKGTLLFVSHDTGSVLSLCDRAVWLDSGSLREVGSAKEVCHNYHASLVNERDNANTFRIGGTRKAPPPEESSVYDKRHEDLKYSQFRNDIEVFSFDPDAPWFGHKGATITQVVIEDPQGRGTPILEGGEKVVLKVHCIAHQEIKKPIVGFFIKDKLGQHLFGDNTFLTYQDSPLHLSAEATFTASFTFQLPYLPTGDYSVLVSIAEGTQAEHIQHQWVDDALFFKVHSSHVQKGLIGVPMLDIDLSPTHRIISVASM